MNFAQINLIVAGHFDTTPNQLMYDQRNDARKAAMLICNEVLKASTIKLARWYGKHQHTTPMRTLRVARNLIETDKTFRTRYKSALLQVQLQYNAELEKKTIKQVYNLNYRVREKGLSVSTRTRTLSITEQQLNTIEGTQVKKLLNQHHYVIQLSLL